MKKPEQKFINFQLALRALEKALSIPPTEDRDFAGIIKSFEFTYELCWKSLQSLLQENGISAPFPRVVFEEAFKRGMIEGNEIWKDIMEARNNTVHTYDQKYAKEMCKLIQERFLKIFQESNEKMELFFKG